MKLAILIAILTRLSGVTLLRKIPYVAGEVEKAQSPKDRILLASTLAA